jgi:hypothetical protein
MMSIWTRTMAGLVLLTAVSIFGAIFTIPGREAKAQRSENQERSESEGKKLEGTWRVQVTARDCQTGAAVRTFPALLTFADGGTLTGTTTAFPPALRGPDHGFWRKTGQRSYLAVTQAFLFNPAGAWTSTQQITQTIEIGHNPDEFTSSASTAFFDTNGNLTMTVCATAVGTRLE